MTINIWKMVSGRAQGKPGPIELLPVSLHHSVSSLDEVSLHLPGGAYTTFRTYRGCYALRLEDHFIRLKNTAGLAGHPVPLDADGVRSALRVLAHASPAGSDLRFRVTVDLEQEPGDVYITAEPLKVPSAADYSTGVQAVTCHLQRLLPEAKLTRFIERAGRMRETLPPGINEAIMADPEGRLREGLSSNFFVVRGSVLWTAETGVLAGITRSTALECARGLGVEVCPDAVALDDIPLLDEAFITSASRGILPLRSIDEIGLRAGAPGPITRRLMQAFDRALGEEIEPI